MRRNSIFWGSALVIIGLLFFLKAQGIISGDVTGYIWPVMVMLFGLWIVFNSSRSFTGTNNAEEHNFSIPLQGAKRGKISFEHGAGAVIFSAGESAENFMSGISGAAMEYSSHLKEDTLHVDIEAGPSMLPFLGPEGGRWDFSVNKDIPFDFSFEGGATSFTLNAEDLKLEEASIEGGASSFDITAPRAGKSKFSIEGGAASIKIKIPEGVALRFLFEGGATSINVDTNRFPRIHGDHYESPDFETASNRCEVTFDGGASTITIS